MVFLVPALLLAIQAEPNGVTEQLKTFTDAYAIVEREAADPVSPESAIYGGAIPGMLRRLDPFTTFFDPEQFDQLKELQTSTRKGFGSVLSVLPGRVVVLQTLPGTPAARSGIEPGDEILAVNGVELARLDLQQLMAFLERSRQSPVRLDVRRPGSVRLLQLTLTPAELQAPSVERAFLLRPGIGYVRVTSFDADTGAQIHEAVEKLGGAKLHGLVLDLRDNPGGVLAAALDSATLFLKPGQKLLSVRGRTVVAKDEVTPADASPYEFPVAALVNSKTASAAEILAGALQDHDRAAILGEPSYGKGLVQSVYPLSQKTGLAVTTAYYYTPSGRSIQKPLGAGAIQPGAIDQRAERRQEYRTDSGRVVAGGGGIQPDQIVYPEPLTRFRVAIETSGAFTSFATEYTRAHKDITEGFEVTAETLDQFHLFLSERQIRPAVSEWLAERGWISSRLKAEIFNQSLGVERGDEVEVQRDPAVLAALEKLGAPGGSWRLSGRPTLAATGSE
jgi:carboxyl-terminal processing protease